VVIESIFNKHDNVYYLIDKNQNKEELKNGKLVVINQQVFMELIKQLHIGEARNLQTIYLLNHYANIDQLSKMFETNKAEFINTVEEFLKKLRELTASIRKNNVSKELVNDQDFLNLLAKVIQLDQKTINTTELINSITDYYRKTHKFPELKIRFRQRDNAIASMFHQQKLEKSLDKLDPKEPLTEYDKEIYKFNQMLDNYQVKLNAYPSDVGKISLNTRDYQWKNNKITDEVAKYYNQMHIKSINIKDPKMEAFVYSYLEGLMWVFNQYFNSYHDNELVFSDTWYFPYDHAPLLTQIYQYLQDKGTDPNYLEAVSKGLKKYKISRSNFFTPIEQLLYVTPPYKNLDYVPEEYQSFFRTKLYSQMDKLVINCKGVRFIGDCHIHGIEFKISDNDFIYEVRKIKAKSQNLLTNVEFFKY
jgi:hypothetical protein